MNKTRTRCCQKSPQAWPGDARFGGSKGAAAGHAWGDFWRNPQGRGHFRAPRPLLPLVYVKYTAGR